MADHSPRDDERRAWLWSRVRALATAENTSVALRHVCSVAVDALGATDVVVYQVVATGRSEPVNVTGSVGDWLSEAEITFGEGPAIDCLREEYPVFAPDLTYERRWPVYAPFAVSHGVASSFAFPVMMGAMVVGCLEAHRASPDRLKAEQVVDGLLLADAAMLLLLRADPPDVGADPFSDGVEARWATVHQATGMASVQLGSDLSTAFVRLRAYAYRTGTRLADVAAQVLEHKLRFNPDADVEHDDHPG